MITYEDENGAVSEPIEKELSLTVTEQMDQDPGMDGSGDFPAVTEPEGSSKYGKLIIPAVVAALVIGTFGTVFVLKRRKRKKEALEEENNNEI